MGKMTTTKWLHGHHDEDSAYYVDDYPYGFTARATIRYWIESTRHGDRMCSQTRNPKSGAWNKPKKSTYIDVGFLLLNDEGNVSWGGIRVHTDPEYVDQFVADHDGWLSKAQLEAVARIRGIAKAFEKVTFTIRETTGLSATENAALDVEQDQAWRRVSALASLETDVARRELALPAAGLKRVL